MISDVILLFSAAGLPYYFLLEKTSLNSKYIFLIVMALFIGSLAYSSSIVISNSELLVAIALISSIVTIYKATKTTNFYKLGYYIIFVNAPFFFLFEKIGYMYSVSLMVTLVGLYLIGQFYEKNYGSANYHHITGITLVTPCVGTYLMLYVIALALYPPFPTSLFFIDYILQGESSVLIYTTIIVLFFGNFFLAMGVMKKTLFGRPNSNIHYVHMNMKEKIIHFTIILILLFLSYIGLKETLA